MNILFTLISFLCLTVFAQDTLKVMTYNLQGMKPGTDPETRLANIILKLKEIDPDIIGLQEVNESLNGGGVDNQARRIADSLSAHFGIPYDYYISFTHLSWNNQFREYIGIVSKYAVQSQGFLSLPPGIFPRKVVWNSVDTPLGKVNFFNTHLSFNSGTVRVQQVQQIIPYIDQQEAGNPGIASILTGDFNDPPNAPSIQLLTNTGTDTFYIDTYAEANPGDPGYTVPANAPNSRIDYIFLKSTGNLSVADSRIVMDQPYSGNNYCSDHLGVLTRLVLKPTGKNTEPGTEALPRTMQLEQNYPNPFNSLTVIRFRISISTFVELVVYDQLGRKVKTLVSEWFTAGEYKVQWDGRNELGQPVASGVYLNRLIVGRAQRRQAQRRQASPSAVQSRSIAPLWGKMVLLR